MTDWLKTICEQASRGGIEGVALANQAMDAAGCIVRCGNSMALVAALIERCNHLEDELATQPLTADGVRVTHGMTLFRHVTIRGRHEIQESNPIRHWPTFESRGDGEPVIGRVIQKTSLCYSSREAAEKAAKDEAALKESLAGEVERLRQYAEEQCCECHDEWGNPKPHRCHRCRVLHGEDETKGSDT